MSAIISLTPNYWSFGSVTRDSTTDKTSTISNVGSSDMTIGAMTGLSSPYSLATDLSGTVIGTGSGADFVVRYNPSVNGASNQVLTINNDSTNFPAYEFGVDGTATSAIISVDPSGYSFGILKKNDTSTQSFRITNNGNVNLYIGDIGAMVSPFAASGIWPSDSTVIPGAFVDATVVYMPTELGVSTDYIEIASNDLDNPDLHVNVDGTCQQAVFSITPSAKVFTPSPRNTIIDQTVSVSNSGNVNMVMGATTGIALPFTLLDDNVSSATMAPDTTNTFVVRYDATALGTYISTLTVYSNDPNNLATSFNLDGRCQESDISVSPAYKSFGNSNVKDSTSTQVFRITNNGNVNLILGTIGSMVFPYYAAGIWPSDATIAPAGYVDATVLYIPSALGVTTDYLEIPSNDPDTPTLNVYMDGTCQQAVIGVSPTLKAFGTHDQGTTTDQTVTITNNGNIAMVMGTLSGLAVPYSMVNNTVSGATINVGDSSTMVVRYAPVNYGATSDTLVIPSNDAATPSYSFNVTGTSSAEDISVSPASHAFGLTPCGFLSDVVVTVSNVGDQDLTMTSLTGCGDQSPFSIINDHVSGQTITAGGSRTFTVRFLTLKKASSTGTIVINSSDPDTPAYAFVVTGNSNMVIGHGIGSRKAVLGQLYDRIS